MPSHTCWASQSSAMCDTSVTCSFPQQPVVWFDTPCHHRSFGGSRYVCSSSGRFGCFSIGWQESWKDQGSYVRISLFPSLPRIWFPQATKRNPVRLRTKWLGNTSPGFCYKIICFFPLLSSKNLEPAAGKYNLVEWGLLDCMQREWKTMCKSKC